MRVRATKAGFYGQLRLPDTDSAEFEVPDGAKASWFEPVNLDPIKPAKGKKADVQAEQSADGAEVQA